MTTETDLRAAVAHIQRITIAKCDEWEADDIPVVSETTDPHIATILNAVASGDLVLNADVDGLVGALDFAVVNSRIYGVTPDSKGRQVWHDNAVGSVARAALTAWENRK